MVRPPCENGVDSIADTNEANFAQYYSVPSERRKKSLNLSHDRVIRADCYLRGIFQRKTGIFPDYSRKSAIFVPQ
jgi:hypothetical protein